MPSTVALCASARRRLVTCRHSSPADSAVHLSAMIGPASARMQYAGMSSAWPVNAEKRDGGSNGDVASCCRSRRARKLVIAVHENSIQDAGTARCHCRSYEHIPHGETGPSATCGASCRGGGRPFSFILQGAEPRAPGCGRLTSLESRRADRSFIGAESGVCAQQYIAAHDTYDNQELLRTRARTTVSQIIGRDRPRRRADRPSLPPSPHPQPPARPLQYTIPEIEPLWVATMLCEYPGISSASRALAEEIYPRNIRFKHQPHLATPSRPE